MSRTALVLVALVGPLLPAGASFAQSPGKTIRLEVWVPPRARLFIEGQEMRASGAMRLFVSPPLADGKYTYTFKAVFPGPKGEEVVTKTIAVRPGDFEMVDLRSSRGKGTPDCRYEPTPQKVVNAMLRLANVTRDDVLWDLGCGDGRVPITAAKKYGCKARGFDIDPARVKESRDNVKKSGVDKLVTIQKKDIFTLDLSKEPTVVTLYLLPHLNAKLLPQLCKLPKGARVISNSHRMRDIKPDAELTVDTGADEFTIYMWTVETLKAAVPR